MLAATDPLTRRPRRVLVAGTSGAGKTTLATAIVRGLARANASRPDLPIVRLRNHREAAQWLAEALTH